MTGIENAILFQTQGVPKAPRGEAISIQPVTVARIPDLAIKVKNNLNNIVLSAYPVVFLVFLTDFLPVLGQRLRV